MTLIGSILLPVPPPTPSRRISILRRLCTRPGVWCSLSKQGHQFLSSVAAAGDLSSTQRLLRKFVSSSSKGVVLSTLSHLLSPTTSHPYLITLALPLYSEISEASWFTWNQKLVADMIALLYKLERFDEAEDLMTETLSKLGNREPDLCSFYSQLLVSQSKHQSEKGVFDSYNQLRQLLSRSTSVNLKRRGYVSMIDALCFIGSPGEAEILMEEMKELGLKPSKFELRSLVYSYGKLGSFTDMERILVQMESLGFELDTVSSNMVLSSFGSQYELPKMVSLLQKMKVSGVPFSIRTYNSVLNSCPAITLLLQHPTAIPISLDGLLANLNQSEADLVKELVGSSVLEDAMEWNSKELKLDLHGMHLGSAYAIILQWFHLLRCKFMGGNEIIPAEITVVCGAGKHSIIRGESPVKGLIKGIMLRIKCPLRIDRKNVGCFIGKGKSFVEWLKQT